MFRRHDLFNHNSTPIRDAWSGLLLQGLILILFGILILVVPQLLVALVSFFFMALGGLMLWAVVANSYYRGLSGRGVTWKGRTYGAD